MRLAPPQEWADPSTNGPYQAAKELAKECLATVTITYHAGSSLEQGVRSIFGPPLVTEFFHLYTNFDENEFFFFLSTYGAVKHQMASCTNLYGV